MNYITACINFHGIVKLIFPDFIFQFSLLLFFKIKNVFLICVSCHPLHDISKTPNFYRVALSHNFCQATSKGPKAISNLKIQGAKIILVEYSYGNRSPLFLRLGKMTRTPPNFIKNFIFKP